MADLSNLKYTHPGLKKFIVWCLSSMKHPRPRLWTRIFVNPLFHKRMGAKVCMKARLDVFPWRKFVLGKGAIIEDYAVVNNGAGDVFIGEKSRIGIGSVVVGPIKIGDECLIGANSCVCGGVTIGNRVQVGAGSVVTKDLPDACVAVGNPAKVIKMYNPQNKKWERV